jgi:hypothetical protein
MPGPGSASLICALVLVPLCCSAQAPKLEEILERLAANQEKAVEARNSVVYRQDTWVKLLRTNGKLSREEKRQYTVTPTATRSDRKLDHFEGRYEQGGKLLPYDEPGFTYKDTDIDGELIESLTDDLINDGKSRDGLAKDMFPLTSKEQRFYRFKLKGRREVAGVDAWQILFEPMKGDLGDHRPWKGEVLVHPEEYQPLLVTTNLALKIPVVVKIMLGIDIKQLGFQVTYRKAGEDLWFPATYGTEFGLKLFFGYKRNVTMNVTNADFRRTSAESTIQFQEPGP